MKILIALLVFGVIVLVHEFGHFIMAKKNGIKVHEFAIGMGPKIFSIKKDTEYTIRLLPLGGFIRMEGEDEESDHPDSFNRKSILQRISVIFAGPFFNIVFTILVLIVVLMTLGAPSTTIKQVMPDSPAKQIGLMEGDKIVNIDGKKIDSWDQLADTIEKSKGKELDVKISRDGKEEEVKVTPKNEAGSYKLGIVPKYEKNIANSFTGAVKMTVNMAVQMVTFVGQLITGTLPKSQASAITGPVGIISMVGDASQAGFINVLYLMAIISLNLGIINLLPLPALDGGRLLFLIIEGLRGGKKIDANKEGMVHFIGFAVLMAFMVFITYKDIIRLMK